MEKGRWGAWQGSERERTWSQKSQSEVRKTWVKTLGWVTSHDVTLGQVTPPLTALLAFLYDGDHGGCIS